jgi:hypothetical protein
MQQQKQITAGNTIAANDATTKQTQPDQTQ